MTRTELQEIIDREFDSFIDFPGDRREAVTATSCKLFAEHVVGVIQTRPAVPDEYVPVPSVPDGYSLVPSELTSENGAKYALIGKFHEYQEGECEACYDRWLPDLHCDVCGGTGEELDNHQEDPSSNDRPLCNPAS